MKIRALLPALILLFSHGSIAQRALIWHADTSMHFTGRVAYNQVRVIDDRRTRASIGYLRTGAFNRYAELQMEDSVDKSLEAISAHVLNGAQTSPGEMLIILRDLRIEDRKGSEEIGTVHLRADLFIGSANAFVHLKNFDSLYETKSGWDVTKAVQDMGSDALLSLLMQGKDYYPDPNAVFTVEEALARERTFRQSFPVYNVDSPRRGIYNTANDFLQLKPSDTDFLDARYASSEGPAHGVFYHPNAKGKRSKVISPEECFAIYDGRNWYVSRRGGFSLLRKEESGDFYTILQLKGLTDNSAMMGMMFGVIGAAIAAGDNGKYYTDYRVRMMPDAGKFAPVGRVR